MSRICLGATCPRLNRWSGMRGIRMVEGAR